MLRLPLLLIALLSPLPGPNASIAPERLPEMPALLQPVAGRTCRSVSTCREAVILWCSGYDRADGDGDGIPCETVCRSIREVNAIREEIGC